MLVIQVAALDPPPTTRAPELDNRNTTTLLRADAERWTGVDDSAGEGISREDIGRCLRFPAGIKFMPCLTSRGRELPPILVDIVHVQSQWVWEAAWCILRQDRDSDIIGIQLLDR